MRVDENATVFSVLHTLRPYQPLDTMTSVSTLESVDGIRLNAVPDDVVFLPLMGASDSRVKKVTKRVLCMMITQLTIC